MSDAHSPGAGADGMFVTVKGAADGVTKRETLNEAHKREIVVLGCSWGMHARPR